MYTYYLLYEHSTLFHMDQKHMQVTPFAMLTRIKSHN